jgi:hypothetical protein
LIPSYGLRRRACRPAFDHPLNLLRVIGRLPVVVVDIRLATHSGTLTPPNLARAMIGRHSGSVAAFGSVYVISRSSAAKRSAWGRSMPHVRHSGSREKKTLIASEQDRPDVIKQRVAWRASQELIDPAHLLRRRTRH